MAEIITLKNLGFTGKPIVIYNINGFYDGLIKLFEEMKKEGFWKEKGAFEIVDTLEEVIQYLEETPSFKGDWE